MMHPSLKDMALQNMVMKKVNLLSFRNGLMIDPLYTENPYMHTLANSEYSIS